MLQHAVITYFAIALAELPDKTMLATLMLSSKYKNRLAVWCGVTIGYAAHVVVAVSFGAVLTRLPREPIQVVVGMLFITGGILTLRSHGDRNETELDSPATKPRSVRVIWLAASVILVAEFADLTQLATAGFAVRFNDPVSVGIGAILALSSVSGIGVLAGSWIRQHVPLRVVQRVAGIVFIAIGGSIFVAVVF